MAPKPPDFPVGPEVTWQVVDMLSHRPNMSDGEIASVIGANLNHPFFQTDLALARLYVNANNIPAASRRITQLEKEQRGNVLVAVALRANDEIINEDVDANDAEKALHILDAMERVSLTKDDVVLAIWVDRLMRTISKFAGEITIPTETLMRDYLTINQDLSETPIRIDEEKLKQVISDEKRNETSKDARQTPDTTDDNLKSGVLEDDTEGDPNAKRKNQHERKVDDTP